jgi:hypothetical protein
MFNTLKAWRYIRSPWFAVAVLIVAMTALGCLLYARWFPRNAADVQRTFNSKLVATGDWKDIHWVVCEPQAGKAEVLASLGRQTVRYRFGALLVAPDYTMVRVYPTDDVDGIPTTKSPVVVYDCYPSRVLVRQSRIAREDREWVRSAAITISRVLNGSM